MISFGGQTVGFVTVTDSGDPGYLGLKSKTRALVRVAGCHFRPVATAEVQAQTDVSTEVWKLTAPPAVAALAAEATGEIAYDGTDSPEIPVDPNALFRITGPIQPKSGPDGSVHHVTVMCRRQRG